MEKKTNPSDLTELDEAEKAMTRFFKEVISDPLQNLVGNNIKAAEKKIGALLETLTRKAEDIFRKQDLFESTSLESSSKSEATFNKIIIQVDENKNLISARIEEVKSQSFTHLDEIKQELSKNSQASDQTVILTLSGVIDKNSSSTSELIKIGLSQIVNSTVVPKIIIIEKMLKFVLALIVLVLFSNIGLLIWLIHRS